MANFLAFRDSAITVGSLDPIRGELFVIDDEEAEGLEPVARFGWVRLDEGTFDELSREASRATFPYGAALLALVREGAAARAVRGA